MDKITKLLRKVPAKDRPRLEEVIAQVVARDIAKLQPEKLTGYVHFYRVRVGDYRIIYYDDGQETDLIAVKRRNESTYKIF